MARSVDGEARRLVSPLKAGGLSLVVLLVVATLYFVFALANFPRPASLEDLSHLLAGLAAVFSALALVGVAASLWLQRSQVEIQQEQLLDQMRSSEEQLRLAILGAYISSSQNLGTKDATLRAAGEVLEPLVETTLERLSNEKPALSSGD